MEVNGEVVFVEIKKKNLRGRGGGSGVGVGERSWRVR